MNALTTTTKLQVSWCKRVPSHPHLGKPHPTMLLQDQQGLSQKQVVLSRLTLLTSVPCVSVLVATVYPSSETSGFLKLFVLCRGCANSSHAPEARGSGQWAAALSIYCSCESWPTSSILLLPGCVDGVDVAGNCSIF